MNRRAGDASPSAWMPTWWCLPRILPSTCGRSPACAVRFGTAGCWCPVSKRVYETDLAYVHDAGFTTFANRAAPQILRILRRHGIHYGLVVDVGCGSGPLAAHLIASGYDVLGIDASAAMIRLARTRVPRARFRRASLEDARIPPCSAMIALNEVIS